MQITRRAALKGGTAVATCAAVTTAAGAMAAVGTGETDPVVALRAERERLRSTINDLADHYDGHTADRMASSMVGELCRTEVQILESEPQTLAGALAQVEQLCLWERDGMPTAGGEEIIGRLIEALPERIERLAAEVQS